MRFSSVGVSLALAVLVIAGCGQQPEGAVELSASSQTSQAITGPPQARPFVDGVLLQGDSTNIFPNSQSRLSPGIVSHSAPIAPFAGGWFTNSRHTLSLRYSQPHDSSGVIQMNLMSSATGSTLVSGTLTFAPTTVDGAGPWRTLTVSFPINPSWPDTVYVRLAFVSGQVTYFDAAWID